MRLAIGTLTLSAVAFGAIVAYEGYSPVAYTPVPGDKLTIGFGSTEQVRPGDTITAPKAVIRALQDMGKYEGAVKQCVQVPLHQYEYDSFLSLAYNIGPTAFCGSTLVKKLNAGDYAGACREILRWNRFQGRELAGLTKRRETEFRRCNAGTT